MLWRSSHQIRQSVDVPLPPLSGNCLSGEPWVPRDEFVLVGALGLHGLGEMEIWLRVLETVAIPKVFAVFRETWAQQEISTLDASVPRSRHANTLIVADPEGDWQDLLAPDSPNRAFAAFVRGKVAEILMLGLPTEEALDTFTAVILRSTGQSGGRHPGA